MIAPSGGGFAAEEAMGDYRLDQLSPREFEHVIQALTINNLGVASVIWGDGPDGGREATFEGVFRNPVTGASTDGLVVVQAKFLQRPHKESAAQAKWALGHLQSELGKYKPGGLEPPDAYIFATNAVLPPVGAGPKDRFRKELEEFRKQHKMQFVLAWDFDQIRALLDNARDVRIRYSCLTTPGDVLHAALQRLEGIGHSLDAVIPRVLQSELQMWSTSSLPTLDDEGGSASHLAQVFMDLPAIEEHSAEPAWHATNPPFGALSKLLEIRSEAAPIVLLGGPGQGKTTVLAMLAQVHRSALLRSYDRLRLSPLTTLEIDRVNAAISRLKITAPLTGRLPLWIDARKLGSFLRDAAPDRRSIWHYVATAYTAIAKSAVSASSLKQLISMQPTFLIIDGYDESPPTQRVNVLEAVSEAVDEARFEAFDMAVVISSRPQAYSNELRPHSFESWSLEPLSLEQASTYGKTLIRTRHAAVEEALDKFQKASSHAEVESLLSTPLHVSLIASLVLAAAELPRERFRLFQAYYDHVYKREQARNPELSAFLETNRVLVDELHRRVAFAIQLAAEYSNAVVGLSLEDFTTCATKCVDESARARPQHRAELVKELLRFARERLVLIVGIDSDTVGFQIKPLTDFLAAAHLLATSNEEIVRNRFRAIMHLPHWRDVTRFMGAAGFDRHALRTRDMRDSVALALRELDDPSYSGVDALRRKGASLAVDILSDSGLGPADFHSRHLWPSPARAAELMHSHGFKQTLSRLTTFADDAAWIEEVRYLCLRSSKFEPLSRKPWDLLTHVARHGGANAAQFARGILKSATPEVLTVALPSFTAEEVDDDDALQDCLRMANPNAVSISSVHDGLPKALVWARTAWAFLHGGPRFDLHHRLDGHWPLSGAISTQAASWLGRLVDMPEPHHPNWNTWKSVGILMSGSFAVEDVARIASDEAAMNSWGVRTNLPWPVVEYARTGSTEFDSRPQDWRTAEERWSADGVRLVDVESYLQEGALSRCIAKRSFPIATIYWSTSASDAFEELARSVSEVWEASRPVDERYKHVVAEKILLPMEDHAWEEGSSSVFDLAFLSRVALSAVRGAPQRGVVDDDGERHFTTCATVTAALAGTEDDAEFVELAEGFLSWGWSSNVDDAVPYAADVIRRCSQLLRLQSFEKLCTNISERTSDIGVWEQLERHWLASASVDDADIAKRLLLMPSLSLATPDDVRAAAQSDIWRLSEVLYLCPGIDASDRAEFLARLLIEADYSGVIGSPVFGKAKRMQFPNLCDILSELEL